MGTAFWFYIGYALRKEYINKREVYLSSLKKRSKEIIGKFFKLHFLGRYSKILIAVFVTAIPWYMIAGISNELRLKDI